MQLGAAFAEQNLDELDDGRFAVVLRLVRHCEQFGVRLRRDPAANVCEHLTSFFLPADGGKVTRRVGEEANARDEEDRGDALESKQEPPPDRGQAIVDEGEPEGDPVRQRDTDCGRERASALVRPKIQDRAVSR